MPRNWSIVEVSNGNGDHVVIDGLSSREANQVVKTLEEELGATQDRSDRYTSQAHGDVFYEREVDPSNFTYSKTQVFTGDEDLEDSYDRELDIEGDPDEVLAESSAGFRWLW